MRNGFTYSYSISYKAIIIALRKIRVYISTPTVPHKIDIYGNDEKHCTNLIKWKVK